MPALATNLRNDLGRVIVKARRVAEAGARKGLESLAVERREPHESMSPDERALRNRLRARGRQLGDVRDKQQGTQFIDRLTHEVAYEHWHRMLFARFLAENNLLIHPEHGVAVSLGEIEELAREAGGDPHTMAARFAQDSLPQIFRSGDPVFEITLAPETRQALDKLLDSLPVAVFTADDSLGWTYQYWQTEKKAEVNASGNKIGADELPAVTQLFTEHYMVLFLYHNSIGAWHAGKVLAANPSLAETARSEEELRQAVRLRSQSGYDFEYLRFVREPKEGDEEDAPSGPWRPAASAFEGWPKTAKELKVLDPCCGSGHFLTEGFEILFRLRMDEEGLDLKDAIHGVLAENLYGLELDPRCTQIAAFNLAMSAWKMVGKPIKLPALHIACSGLAVGSTKTEWTKLAGNDERLRNGMEWLYNLFEQAPELGSLIDPKALKGDLLVADLAELQPLLERVLARETDNIEDAERAVAAQGMARAAELISDQYTLVITNVPYLEQRKHSSKLHAFCQTFYSQAKGDLASVFVDRSFGWLVQSGTSALVTPQNWLYLTTYGKLRTRLLETKRWHAVAKLGHGAFNTITGQVVQPVLMILTGHISDACDSPFSLDASACATPEAKSGAICSQQLTFDTQQSILENPDARIVFGFSASTETLGNYAWSLAGIMNGDSPKFLRLFWELPEKGDLWAHQQTTVETTRFYGGRRNLVFFDEEEGHLREDAVIRRTKLHNSDERGNQVWGRCGVAITQMSNCPVALYNGHKYDSNIAVVSPHNANHLLPIWVFCRSPEFVSAVKELEPKMNVTNATFAKLPFDLTHWQKVAAQKYPNGLPEPQSDDPIQWLFHGYPAKAEPASVLQVTVGRLLGYRWPPELDPEMRLADEARERVSRCDALKVFADEDGIVCLLATRGEHSAAERLRDLLSATFGSDWSAAKERELLAVAGDAKKPAASLDIWLRDKFFEEHCKLFHHRPFVWHVWDGNKDGFHCLVNAHKLTGPDGESRRTLEAITYSYLGDWIDRQRAAQQESQEGADARLAAAQDLQGQLEKILEGEPPYDLFVRWKPLHEQAIGWEPDINDGVRLNIRPFMNAELRIGGKKGAGILRWKPNIKWQKDRGKESQSLRPKAGFPWFWACKGDDGETDRTDFDGNRWNDLHFTRATKETARAAAVTKSAEVQA